MCNPLLFRYSKRFQVKGKKDSNWFIVSQKKFTEKTNFLLTLTKRVDFNLNHVQSLSENKNKRLSKEKDSIDFI